MLFSLLAALLFVTQPAHITKTVRPTATDLARRWPVLLDQKEYDAARALCTDALSAKEAAAVVEAHKCLANVALAGAEIVTVTRTGIGSGYEPSDATDAVAHLEAAMQLAPQDISIHQGRLHVLMASGQGEAMVTALKDSIRRYKGRDGLDAWLDYCPGLFETGEYETGLAFTRVLLEHYPKDHRVVGNVGGFLALLERDDEAECYLRSAVALSPNDPIDLWNLGRLLHLRGKAAEADGFYLRALAVGTDPDQDRERRCIYGHFVESAMGEREKACALQRESCPEEERSACSEPPR